MELKFESIQELEKFIEKMGYVKNEEQKEKEEELQENSPLTLTIKECPYGFVYCPYNRKIDPYSPASPFYYNQGTITSLQNNENSAICKKKEINIEKLSKENDT